MSFFIKYYPKVILHEEHYYYLYSFLIMENKYTSIYLANTYFKTYFLRPPQLSTAGGEEITKICIVLWGIWFWRKKRVWEDKSVSTAIAMGHSFSHVEE